MTSPDRLAAARDAVIAGNLAKLRLLLKSGVPADAPLPGSSLLRLAARFGHAAVFDALVDAGARIDDPELLEYAADGKTPSPAIIARILAEAAPAQAVRDAALRFASVQGGGTAVAALIAAGADVNARDPFSGDCALLNAILHGQEEAAALLLEAGADPQVRVLDDPAETPAENPHKGRTALELAEALGHTDIAARLRAAG
ncbi:ankyrin repeat domain-containing protein [Erythrobacter sp. CCH5-A1]|jgi:ankyrin repeat protein|uniref:ankyrin repeat domain-containing protein n=1 Tax=Erythrobacter sp. CCH5-A1 TaxID=1768792 RepID=UPI00082ECC52|nr:ankyrin repeat domain-containing protein [Erythrobacter sp. CCH5-A1]